MSSMTPEGGMADKQDLIECLICRKFWTGVTTEKCPHCGGPELATVGAMHKCQADAMFDQCVNCGAMAEELAKPCKAFMAKAEVLQSQAAPTLLGVADGDAVGGKSGGAA